MESWTTHRLVVLMAVIAVCYLIGRWVAETVQALVASGALPTFER